MIQLLPCHNGTLFHFKVLSHTVDSSSVARSFLQVPRNYKFIGPRRIYCFCISFPKPQGTFVVGCEDLFLWRCLVRSHHECPADLLRGLLFFQPSAVPYIPLLKLLGAAGHAVRAFMLLGLIAGAVSFFGLCTSFFKSKVSSMSLIKTSANASILAALCVMIAMAIFTGASSAPGFVYGWSFIFGWASFPLFLITGVVTNLSRSRS
uniref:Uncharacterized protein isoform X3 n=1 Tax=Pogona vitticeps TaxID=103695 RepID=A0ABM5ERQ4_9SAUR